MTRRISPRLSSRLLLCKSRASNSRRRVYHSRARKNQDRSEENAETEYTMSHCFLIANQKPTKISASATTASTSKKSNRTGACDCCLLEDYGSLTATTARTASTARITSNRSFIHPEPISDLSVWIRENPWQIISLTSPAIVLASTERPRLPCPSQVWPDQLQPTHEVWQVDQRTQTPRWNKHPDSSA